MAGGASKGDRFSEAEIPDQSGKVAIVTGGNGGIGYEIVRQLARLFNNVLH